jgi:hypothetical protein
MRGCEGSVNLPSVGTPPFSDPRAMGYESDLYISNSDPHFSIRDIRPPRRAFLRSTWQSARPALEICPLSCAVIAGGFLSSLACFSKSVVALESRLLWIFAISSIRKFSTPKICTHPASSRIYWRSGFTVVYLFQVMLDLWNTNAYQLSTIHSTRFLVDNYVFVAKVPRFNGSRHVILSSGVGSGHRCYPNRKRCSN